MGEDKDTYEVKVLPAPGEPQTEEALVNEMLAKGWELKFSSRGGFGSRGRLYFQRARRPLLTEGTD